VFSRLIKVLIIDLRWYKYTTKALFGALQAQKKNAASLSNPCFAKPRALLMKENDAGVNNIIIPA